MSTYRERRMARAERLRQWAGKREVKAAAADAEAHARADAIPFGQPILAGHHSEGRDRRYRDSIVRKTEQGIAHAGKAREMASKAANIEAAADRAIYDDDPDAVERLRERITELETARDRIKRYNASCRRGARDLELLDDQQRAQIVRLAEVVPYQVRAGGAFPAYVTSNLSGQIGRYRKRLAALKAREVGG